MPNPLGRWQVCPNPLDCCGDSCYYLDEQFPAGTISPAWSVVSGTWVANGYLQTSSANARIECLTTYPVANRMRARWKLKVARHGDTVSIWFGAEVEVRFSWALSGGYWRFFQDTYVSGVQRSRLYLSPDGLGYVTVAADMDGTALVWWPTSAYGLCLTTISSSVAITTGAGNTGTVSVDYFQLVKQVPACHPPYPSCDNCACREHSSLQIDLAAFANSAGCPVGVFNATYTAPFGSAMASIGGRFICGWLASTAYGGCKSPPFLPGDSLCGKSLFGSAYQWCLACSVRAFVADATIEVHADITRYPVGIPVDPDHLGRVILRKAITESPDCLALNDDLAYGESGGYRWSPGIGWVYDNTVPISFSLAASPSCHITSL